MTLAQVIEFRRGSRKRSAGYARQEEIRALIEGYTNDVIQLERVMATLRQEYRLLIEVKYD